MPDESRVLKPNLGIGAITLLEYGEGQDGYWTVHETDGKSSSNCRGKVSHITRLLTFLGVGPKLLMMNVNHVNAGPGSFVPYMHDTTYDGKIIYMTKQVIKGGCVRNP